MAPRHVKSPVRYTSNMEKLTTIHNYSDRWEKAPRNQVFNCSADALLWRLPRVSIDIFWFSPPYNLADRFRASNYQQTGKKLQYEDAVGFRGDGTGMPENVYQNQQALILSLCSAALKPSGLIFYSHKVRIKDGVSVNPRIWIDRSGLQVIQEIIWNRGGTAQTDPRRLYPVYETVYILANERAIKTRENEGIRLINSGRNSGGQGLTDVWDINPKTYGITREKSGHPAAAPLELIRRCLSIVSHGRGALVCDPYCGTGTTGIAAQERGMDYLLCDVSEKWARHSDARMKGDLDAHMRQLPIETSDEATSDRAEVGSETWSNKEEL